SARVLDAALGVAENPAVIASIVTDIARVDPELAINKLLRETPWRDTYGKATSRLFATYVMENPEEGSAAANLLPKDSEAYQWAAAGIVQVIRGADPEATAKWKAEITDPKAAAFAESFTYMMNVRE